MNLQKKQVRIAGSTAPKWGGFLPGRRSRPPKDVGLQLLDDPQQFGDCSAMIAVRRGQVLRGFARRFVELCNPTLIEEKVCEGMTVIRG